MPYPLELIQAIAAHHNLSGDVAKMPDSGMVNEAWLIGDDIVLRILQQEDTDDEALRESKVVPLVRSAGVSSPELIAADLSCSIAPRPYTIYRRAHGVLLGSIEEAPHLFEALYRKLGHEIAEIHKTEVPDELVPILRNGSTFDVGDQLKKCSDVGIVDNSSRKEIERWISRLDSVRGEGAQGTLLHQDIHPWNLFADPGTRELTAIIDWGDAALGDASTEFASMPLLAMQPMLNGYREAGGSINEGFIARALAIGLSLSLWEIRALPPDRFQRQWWRFPADGWPAVWRHFHDLLAI
jgi:hygromycin-B 7''-O-kinase